MKRILIGLLLSLGLGTPAVVAATAPAQAAPQAASQAAVTAPYCGITWGSLTKAHASTKSAPLVNVRSGRQTCYDRLVLDIAAPGADGYQVRYVTQVVREGVGTVVPLRGGAKLEIVAKAPAYNSSGQLTYRPANQAELTNVTGYQTFRQVAWAGSFEGQSRIGLGVRARLPFRVFVLAGPGAGSRLVIDVAHQW